MIKNICIFAYICKQISKFLQTVTSPNSRHYLRELYFLKLLADHIPVSQVLDCVPPGENRHGAILMEELKGSLFAHHLKCGKIIHQAGVLLAHIHSHRVEGYGDLVDVTTLHQDPRAAFATKFESGFLECQNHLPSSLLKRCRCDYDHMLDRLLHVGAPCVVHRDFRPGNLLVYQDKIEGVIDWSGSRGSFPEEDFITLEHGCWQLLPEQKQVFLAGYTSVAPLPDYHDVMPLLRLSRSLELLGFLLRSQTKKEQQNRLYQFHLDYLENNAGKR